MNEITAASAPHIEAMRRAEEMIGGTRAFDRITRSTAALLEAFQPAILARHQFELAIQDAFSRTDFRHFEELYKGFQFLERLRLHEKHKQLVAILSKQGWTGLERHLSQRNLDRILKLKNSRKIRAVDDYICAQFSKNGHKRLNAIARNFIKIPYLKKRRPKIRQALKHHKDASFDASISMLFPLIDGLAGEIATRVSGLSKRRMRVIKVVEHYHNSEDSVWSECIKRVVCEILYEDVDFENPRHRRIINRHLTLHGHARRYDTQANSLRVILLLDTFGHIARQLIP